MANSSLFYDKFVTDNQNARVRIVGLGNDARTSDRSFGVEAFLADELNLSGGNDFSEAALQQGQQENLNDLAQRLQAVAGAVAGKFGYDSIPSFTLKTLEQSVSTWKGADRPSFSLRVLFVAVRETDDVTVQVNKLYKGVFPSFQSAGVASVVLPPLNYLPQGTSARGTVAVEIGKWFRATGLVIKNVSFKFSRSTLASGKPLYADGTVQFQTYRVLSYDEIQQWFL
jgi:hypothetical protein